MKGFPVQTLPHIAWRREAPIRLNQGKQVSDQAIISLSHQPLIIFLQLRAIFRRVDLYLDDKRGFGTDSQYQVEKPQIFNRFLGCDVDLRIVHSEWWSVFIEKTHKFN